MFSSDLNWIAKIITGKSDADYASLRHISYDYVSGHLGIELGSPNRAVFYLRAGVTYLRAGIRQADLQSDLQKAVNDPSVISKGGVFEYLGPSGRVGFIAYF
jgi:hypothetical protein